ncbi:amidohydrolase/deacetylase family metallohydrolase [Phenylobacterium sp. VNQ135]|uniref:amidohydrolase/deacetylase family metallohydrolase n=1 Tax=Phenylobacterium sp. VNQ135 TaxID=3400922 RepID=UPI003C0C547D
MSGQQDASAATFDVVIRGGRVIDPANRLDGRFDVGVKDGVIAAVAADLPTAQAARVIDAAGKLVTPGLIDTHAHVFQHIAGPFGLNPDEVGVQSGVATLIDQGGPSCLTLDGFRKFIVEPAKTRVRCFLSTYLAGGLYGHIHSSLYGPEQINVDATVRAIRANPDIVVGLKSHAEPGHYSRWGLAVLEKSKEIAREAGVPTYVHLGTLWPVLDGRTVDPQALLVEMIPLMDEGDILAHPFTRHPSGFTDEAGQVHPLVFEAMARGVMIDVGRGNHFSIKVARQVLDAGVMPDTLGADLHGYNISRGGARRAVAAFATANDGKLQTGMDPTAVGGDDPAFSLYYAMSEMLALGVDLPHLVAMTTSNAARMCRLGDTLGSLAVGRASDVAILDLQTGDFTMRDGCGETMTSTQRLRPHLALQGGVVMEPVSELLPAWERRAA